MTSAYLLISIAVLYLAAVVRGASISSCSQLPYPETCRALQANLDPLFGNEKARLGFLDFVVRGAADRAQWAHQQLTTSLLAGATVDPRARAALSDCAELAGDAGAQLERCLASVPTDDAQTFLSAAAANLRTCRDGFADFSLDPNAFTGGRASSYLPFLSPNMSQLISNSLAVNKDSTAPTVTGGNRRLLYSVRGGFSEWMSAADRKLLQAPAVKADVVVAKDGSGNFRTISEAVDAASKRTGTARFVIRVKAGTYSENVDIPRDAKNLMLVGDGASSTVVTGNRNVQDGSTTFKSATVAVNGDGFIARDITFENTAGPQKHQAVALRSSADFSVFHHCTFKGYQDTLYVHSFRQFYRECDIYGTVDFIFGDAAVVFQSCNIFVRKPMSNQKNTITAQGRTDPNENTGISIHNSRVTAASDLKPVQGSFKTYLGRPWKEYSRTVFMMTDLDSLIAPAGWLEWTGDFALNTLYYGEYMNTGPGASTSARVKWPGYRVITSATEAAKFTVGSFLEGNSWIPSTGIPFSSGL